MIDTAPQHPMGTRRQGGRNSGDGFAGVSHARSVDIAI